MAAWMESCYGSQPILYLTSLKVSRQCKRPPLGGLERMHLASINTFHQAPISCIEVEMKDKMLPTKRAQSFRAGLGTCCSVATRTRRISSTEGRIHRGASFRKSSVKREGRLTWELFVAAGLVDRMVELWVQREGTTGS